MSTDDLASAPMYSFHRTFGNVTSVVGRSYEIKDASGQVVCSVANHLEFGADAWVITNAAGEEIARIHRGPLHVHPTFDVTTPAGAAVKISKANFMPLHETWRIEGLDIGDVDIKGNTSDHEFTFVGSGGAVLAQASRQWVTMTEAYGLRIGPSLDMVAVIAAAVALDDTESRH